MPGNLRAGAWSGSNRSFVARTSGSAKRSLTAWIFDQQVTFQAIRDIRHWLQFEQVGYLPQRRTA
jgi:hypothetical protein